MNILTSSPPDRKAESRHDARFSPLPDGVVDRTIGTDSNGADISLSDLHPDDLARWLAEEGPSRPRRASHAPAEPRLIPHDVAAFLANPGCPLD